jgi:hypothetical protein
VKKSKLYLILAIEAVIVAVLYIIARNASYTGASLISFPFGFIGDMLRRLSLRGGVFNILAIVVYALVCICPIIVLISAKEKSVARPENVVLLLLSPIMFFCMYVAINPQLSMFRLSSAESVVRSVAAITIDSLILLYLVLRLVRMVRNSDKSTLYKCLKVLMIFVAVIIVAAFSINVIGENVYALPKSEDGYAFWGLTLKAVFDGANLLLTLLIALWTVKLIDTLSNDSEDLRAVTETLCSLSRVSLVLCAVSSVMLNIFNVLFIDRLNNVEAHLYIPITEIGFALIILLLTRLLIENKNLREDNELFI